MRNLVQRLRYSEFLRHNIIFFAGTVAMGFLNYLYYPVLGRLLDPAAFGEVQTLVSLFVQLLTFLMVMGLITVNLVANFGDTPKVQRTILELERLAFLIGLAVLLAAIVLGPLLRNFLQFDHVLPFVLTALAIVVTVPATFRSAYLRGKKHFGASSLYGLVGAAGKLALSVIFVLAGFGTVGAIVGLVLAQALAYVYAARTAQRAGFQLHMSLNIWRLPDLKLIKPELRYGLLVLTGSLVITAMCSIDIIAAKHYFDARTAGLYAGIATVSRIIFFLTTSISQVLLPAVKLANVPADNRRVLLKSAVLMAGVAGSALAVFWLLPYRAVNLLMGKEYLQYAYLLPRLSLVICIVSFLNLVLLYFIALRRYASGFIAILGLAVTCGLVGMYHNSLQAIVDSMLYGAVFTALMLTVWVIWTALQIKEVRVEA